MAETMDEYVARSKREQIRIYDGTRILATMRRNIRNYNGREPLHPWVDFGSQGGKSRNVGDRLAANGDGQDRTDAWSHRPLVEKVINGTDYVYDFPSASPLRVSGEKLWPICDNLAAHGIRRIDVQSLRNRLQRGQSSRNV